ncbi:putative ATP-dependent RNA helicase TDRD12 isoform X4 [Balearica regulorum gibbericeps]|uniref:putative ATP-dependent RNA helicase TDRD12 isoform X4 n=1 Tax=Balearica regulorum gibbericeps TaxID=100784 RepID=UPI003F5DB4A2
MEVLVLEIEDPGCFWVTMKGCGPYIVDEIEYENLNAEMNQFYDKSYKDMDEVKPLTVEEGQICVVFSEELKCWCRAVIKSIMYCTDHYKTECFLVDYAKYIFVKSKDIRVALEAFMQIPYRAKKCRLYRTKPVTLRIDFCEDTAKIVPANRWDSAATHYFQNLLKATTQMKAKLCAVEDNTFDVFLYVTIKDEKVCVNDDLVSKNFARFEEAKDNTGSSADYQENQTSLNLESLPVKIVNSALAFRPVPFQEKVLTNLETDLAVSRLFPEDTHQRSSTDLNESTAPTVKEIPGLSFKENTAVHTDRFQQFLNSDPLKTHIIEDEQQSFQNLSEERNFVFLSNKIEPSSVLETAPLSDELKKELTRKKFLGPNFTESYCWPPVARGCDVVAISHQGNNPFLYIPPVLTFLQLGSCYKALPNKNGPLALILCPGWKKAQLVFELLKTYERCSRHLHPMLIILGQNKEAAKSVKIQGCEVIVTTPYSLLRLLEHNSLLFCRLCHLVLDEIEVLVSDATEQVFTILECYKKAIIEKWEYSPHQIIAVGTRWNKHIAHLIKEFMNEPYIVITAMEEASIYGNVQQVVRPCTSSERTAVLLKILDFTHNDLQKVLVFTNSVNEAEMVHKALKSNSIISLKIHEGSEFDFKYILEQWTKKYSSGTRVVIVLTDDCMQSLGITDATCVIHFSFPSPRIFGQRLHSMSDNFCNVIKDSSVDQEYTKARSVFLLTEDNACHALGILRYLQHAEAEIPPELYDYSAKTLEAEEDKKLSRPLCAYLKTFGICKNRTVCPDRHQVNLQIDVPQNIPDKITQTPGCVTVTHYINDKIKGKLHEAKIVHTLGNTAWVDPMVRVTRLSDLKMSVNEYNVRSEILSTGLGTDNPEHITQLQKLCGHMDVLHHEKNLDPLSIKEDTAGPENASNPQNMSIQENPTENCNSFKITSGNHPCDGVAQSKEAEDSTLHQHKCFYPEIKWFQNEETVTVKVKIASVADFKCEFSKEKVIFSASSGDKLYWADMELHQYILAEKSTCVIKDKEAIIVLTKEKKGAWCKLLKNKNPHVSFDFQHWEDFEDESPFPVGTKKLYCTAAVAEELVASSEDSGTESDE